MVIVAHHVSNQISHLNQNFLSEFHGNIALGLGSNVKIPAHPAYETMKYTLRWVERLQKENLHCYDSDSPQAVLDSVVMPQPGYDTYCGSIEASVDTKGTESYWCEGVLRHKESGDGHTFEIDEIPWNITVDLYEKYLADLRKQPSIRSAKLCIHAGDEMLFMEMLWVLSQSSTVKQMNSIGYQMSNTKKNTHDHYS